MGGNREKKCRDGIGYEVGAVGWVNVAVWSFIVDNLAEIVCRRRLE